MVTPNSKIIAKYLSMFLCPIPICQFFSIFINAANDFTLSWSANLRASYPIERTIKGELLHTIHFEYSITYGIHDFDFADVLLSCPEQYRRVVL